MGKHECSDVKLLEFCTCDVIFTQENNKFEKINPPSKMIRRLGRGTSIFLFFDDLYVSQTTMKKCIYLKFIQFNV